MENKIIYIQNVIDFSRMKLDTNAAMQTKVKAANISAAVIGGYPALTAKLTNMNEPLTRYPLTDKDRNDLIISMKAWRSARDWIKYWNDLIAFQKEWKSALDWIVERTKAPWQLELDNPVIFTWGKSENNVETTFYYGPSPYYEDKEVTVTAYDLTPIYEKTFFGNTPKCHKEKKIFPKGALHFFEALSGYRVSSLLKCPLCKNIFFNPTKRKRIYCSPSCQKTAGVRRVRKKKKAAKK